MAAHLEAPSLTRAADRRAGAFPRQVDPAAPPTRPPPPSILRSTAPAKGDRHRLLRRLSTLSKVSVGLALLLSVSPNLRAEPLEARGLIFSDELGGFRLISASGSGRASDPIVLVEEFSGLGPAVLTIRRSETAGSAPPSSGVLQRSLVKIVINKSAMRWSGFDLELRSETNKASVYSDGLSFDQVRVVTVPLHSDLFAKARIEDEPFDRLRFDQGKVVPDQSVRLAFNLVDVNPRAVFFLAQEPIVLMAEAAPRRRREHAGSLPAD